MDSRLRGNDTVVAASDEAESAGTETPIRNPADHADLVGTAIFARAADVDAALAAAEAAAPGWAATPPADRAKLLLAAADRLEAEMVPLIGLIVREAGKSIADAVGEIREAVDFLRYYGGMVRDEFDNATHRPLGVVVAISPWNFPLSIFLGQVSAALAAGNAVIAKPAEETPLIAAAGIRILHAAGLPRGALNFLPGAGDVGAALCGHAGVGGVVFTGSTEVARRIARQLADRLSPAGRPIPLIAETAGQNAMIVDSSALTEQVVADVLASAFDSAGQRCSALRLLCLQDDVADRTLEMLKGALAEQRTGDPARLATDVGPVITAEARDRFAAYIAAMRDKWHAVTQGPLTPETAEGTFLPPTLIELSGIDELGGEVFGPVLHVIRFRRAELDRLIARINALGYGLTFGLHTRLDETVERVTGRISVGNIYVNRNIIGAVVGVQPFGGHGLSGTGPKAGGPLYLRRFLATRPPAAFPAASGKQPPPAAVQFADWLAGNGKAALAGEVRSFIAAAPWPHAEDFPGPVGESNAYRTEPRGRILVLAETEDGAWRGVGAALATGNIAVLPQLPAAVLPPAVASRIVFAANWSEEENIGGALVEGSDDYRLQGARALAARDGVIVPVQRLDGGLNLDMLVREVALSINTAAAGGNASLMALAEA
jgi:RHH-type proline utilization regulon transcriptional repressor/proline dehydrogenase/delta 1-pyrroline-5-carboxylate dehydrogenase